MTAAPRCGRGLPRNRAELGLTVLEVLIASALLLMFLSSVFGLIWSLADRRAAMEFQTAPYSIGPPVLELVCEDLRNARLLFQQNRKLNIDDLEV